jgi:hypothetical protein
MLRNTITPPNEKWARMPKPKERLCGLSRTTLFELWQRGFIKMAVIRKPRSARGIRLVHLPSLHDHLAGLAEAEQRRERVERFAASAIRARGGGLGQAPDGCQNHKGMRANE